MGEHALSTELLLRSGIGGMVINVSKMLCEGYFSMYFVCCR